MDFFPRSWKLRLTPQISSHIPAHPQLTFCQSPVIEHVAYTLSPVSVFVCLSFLAVITATLRSVPWCRPPLPGPTSGADSVSLPSTESCLWHCVPRVWFLPAGGRSKTHGNPGPGSATSPLSNSLSIEMQLVRSPPLGQLSLQSPPALPTSKVLP